MSAPAFHEFFQGKALDFLNSAIDRALDEDGRDLTSLGLFPESDQAKARIVAKQGLALAGLPVAEMVLARLAPKQSFTVTLKARDGDEMTAGQEAAIICAPAAALLTAERTILNFITHMSGIATLTREYVRRLEGTKTRLLDTRKTLPGLRYPEKYAVRVGGGQNHRMNLEDMLMIKDNHADRAGGITRAVAALRDRYSPCPPIEVECRTPKEVGEAAKCRVDRIMLDNMDEASIAQSLKLIPEGVESEVSGGVSLENIGKIAALGPDYVSVGRITHSAKAADLSMQIIKRPS